MPEAPNRQREDQQGTTGKQHTVDLSGSILSEFLVEVLYRLGVLFGAQQTVQFDIVRVCIEFGVKTSTDRPLRHNDANSGSTICHGSVILLSAC